MGIPINCCCYCDASILWLQPKPFRFPYGSSQSLTVVFGTVLTAVSGFVTLYTDCNSSQTVDVRLNKYCLVCGTDE